MEIPPRDGDGYLLDMNTWTPEIGRAMAEVDGYLLDDAKWAHIMKAREFCADGGTAPPIRIFAKCLG